MGAGKCRSASTGDYKESRLHFPKANSRAAPQKGRTYCSHLHPNPHTFYSYSRELCMVSFLLAIHSLVTALSGSSAGWSSSKGARFWGNNVRREGKIWIIREDRNWWDRSPGEAGGKVLVFSHPVMSDSLWPLGWYPGLPHCRQTF